MKTDSRTLLDKIDKRYRLYISLVLSVIVYLLAKRYNSIPITFMLSWITFACTSLAFSWVTILTSHPRKVRTIAKEQDTSRTAIFLFVVVASFISLFAIVYLLQDIPNISKRGLSFHILLSAFSVLCSWLLIHTLFTLRYAHLYYTCKYEEDGIKKLHEGGLDFPKETAPDYLDFAYFSFVLGMTFQVSDVEITSRHIRRLALLHGFLSFVYNTIIVALSINIISGVISK